ncbi:MAG: chromosome partitioning protein [Flavobacteriaceae bacterium]|jgi:ATP-binding protein involved in chromosome partitioning|nr:chromosome partitioning protein [Flavobacteriaceae bacterium]|tara:strand:+ start:50 stop:1177 length:1128 start_codon:yes stop_codon:yes gene_type:complete
MLTKNQISKILSNVHFDSTKEDIISNGSVKNIVVFDKEIVIDLEILKPTLQAKNTIKRKITDSLKNNIDFNIDVKINFILISEKEPTIYNSTKKIKNVSNIIAISSGKGGVGKSTITANLAVSLSKMGFKVGILDADIYGPSIPEMFDVSGQKPLAVDVDGKSKMKPIENYGVKILSIGFFTKIDQAVIWRGPMASKALNQMIFDADWGILDFLLVDLPPGTGDIHLSIMQSLPISGAVVISTPQKIALNDARKGVSMFKKENINVPVLGIIENMAYFIPNELPENKYYLFGKEGARNLSTDLNIPFLGEVPIIQSVREAADFGRPAAMQENTISEDIFKSVSKNMLSQLLIRNKELPETEIVKITTMSGCISQK